MPQPQLLARRARRRGRRRGGRARRGGRPTRARGSRHVLVAPELLGSSSSRRTVARKRSVRLPGAHLDPLLPRRGRRRPRSRAVTTTCTSSATAREVVERRGLRRLGGGVGEVLVGEQHVARPVPRLLDEAPPGVALAVDERLDDGGHALTTAAAAKWSRRAPGRQQPAAAQLVAASPPEVLEEGGSRLRRADVEEHAASMRVTLLRRGRLGPWPGIARSSTTPTRAGGGLLGAPRREPRPAGPVGAAAGGARARPPPDSRRRRRRVRGGRPRRAARDPLRLPRAGHRPGAAPPRPRPRRPSRPRARPLLPALVRARHGHAPAGGRRHARPGCGAAT